jgi:hypothetical protein
VLECKTNSSIAPIQFLPAPEFIAGFKPPQYVIDGIAQRGMLYSWTAPTSHGKTAVALYMSICISLGLDFAGRHVEQGHVIYFSAENSDDVRARMILIADKMKLDLDALPITFVDRCFDLSEALDQIKVKAEELGGITAVFLDTSVAFQVACGFSDENDNIQAYKFATTLRKLTEIEGRPVVFALTHPTKFATNDLLLPRGGGAFLAEVDGNFTLWKPAKDADTTTMHWAGKFRGATFEPIAFALETGTCSGLVDPKGRRLPSVWARPADDSMVERSEQRRRDDDDAVLIAMNNSPSPASFSSLALALDWKDAEGNPQKWLVQRSVKRLDRDKLVTKIRERYQLTPKGKKEATRLEKQAS